MRGFAWLAVVLLVASACRSNGTFIAAGETPDVTPTPNPFVGCIGDTFRLCVTPIKAAFDEGARTTVYTAHISYSEPAGFASGSAPNISYQWSGPNCGTWLPQELRYRSDYEFDTLFTWSHPHPPCGNTTDHSDVTVHLTASVRRVVMECTYQGSLSGVGQACTGSPY